MDDFKQCTEIADGTFLCNKKGRDKRNKKGKDNTSIIEEFEKAIRISTRPYFTKEEASWVETTWSSVFFGTILSSLGVALGFYIYFLIGNLGFPLIGDDPLFSAIIVIGFIIALILVISFIQNRIHNALKATNIAEKLAVNEDLVDDVM